MHVHWLFLSVLIGKGYLTKLDHLQLLLRF